MSLFIFVFSYHNYSFNFNNTNRKNHRCWAWDSNPGQQNGWRKRNHVAGMTAALVMLKNFADSLATNARFNEFQKLSLKSIAQCFSE